MKKYFISCVLLLLFFAADAQKGFTLKVKVKELDKYVPFLSYQGESGRFIIERNYTVEDGKMVFKGKVDDVSFAYFGLNYKPQASSDVADRRMTSPARSFVLTNSTITLTTGEADKTDMAVVDGGVLNKEYDVALAKISKYEREEREKNANASAPSNQRNSEQNNAFWLKFINENPESIASIYYLSRIKTQLDLDILKAAFTKLSPKYKNIYDGKMIADLIANLEATATGKAAIQINKVDLKGNPVNLNALRGKYVILDFWGSWCGPCRASHPHLKELYSKYKDKGLEILGIAEEHGQTLEDNKRTWSKAVTEDGMTWPQVLNNEGQQTCDAVKLYGVSAFPTKVLLDKEGKIIARYVGDSAELDKKLTEIFGF